MIALSLITAARRSKINPASLAAAIFAVTFKGVSYRFADRAQAGRELAEKLAGFANLSGVAVLGLPRGGVPVAWQVAQRLGAPLDVFVVRKLGVPGQEELALGAIASGGVRVLNEGIIRDCHISQDVIDRVAARERRALEQGEWAFRPGPPLDVRGRIVILADDGLATGATMRAAVAAVMQLNPARVVVAVPVAAPEMCREFAREGCEIVCARAPANFEGVGQWYENFAQTTDEEVRAILKQSKMVSPGL